jgi:BCD family chlorophyll transporter-like MFS transporter
MDTPPDQQSQTEITPSPEPLPRITLFTMFRLGLFQMGLGIMSLLTLGVLNRIMIDELKVLPLIVGLAIAMHQFVSPARVWFGQMSDAKPILGFHRTGYVWIGAALFTSISFLALQVVWQLGSSLQAQGWGGSTYGWACVLALMFAFYGLALGASSTPFAALLVDVSDEDNRPKLVGVVWSMLMVGIVIGAIISSTILDRTEVCGADILTFDPTVGQMADLGALQASVTPLFIVMPAVVFGLCLLATVGIEPRYTRFQIRTAKTSHADEITLGTALRVLTTSQQTGLFFSFLLVMTISLFMQDAVVEPFGGEVFGLCISETTQLNAFFGSGTLVGIGTTGFLLLPRLGKSNTTRLGCFSVAACSLLILLAGLSGQAGLLRGAIGLFGLAAGILTAGATSLMLDLTVAETAGTFIGAWGLAQAMARGLATVIGGGVLNLGKILFDTPALSYGLVFFLQAVGMILAVALLNRVNVEEFRAKARQAITQVFAGDLDT